MSSAARWATYLLHGFPITSQLPLGDPWPAMGRESTAVVHLHPAQPPAMLDAPWARAEGWDSAPDGLELFDVKDGQIMRVVGLVDLEIRPAKRRIDIRPHHPDLTGRDLAYWCETMPFARLLIAQGFLPLHASAVVRDSRAVAFAGPAGRGKSTLVAALAARGARVATDDMSALRTVGEDALLTTTRSAPVIRLTQLSLETLSSSGLSPGETCFAGGKWHVRMTTTATSSAFEPEVRLSRVYFPIREQAARRPSARRLACSSTAALLATHCISGSMLRGRQQSRLLERASQIAQAVEAFELRVPDRLDSLGETADWLWAHLSARTPS